MSIKRSASSGKLTKILLFASIVSMVLAVLLFFSLDSLINSALYQSFLQFDNSWYISYSTYSKLIYACLTVSAVISVDTLVLSFRTKAIETSPPLSSQPAKSISEAFKEEKPKKILDGGNICPNCNKTFTRPLVTLDFVYGKPLMVNTCPYCSHLISEADETSGVEVRRPEEEIEQ